MLEERGKGESDFGFVCCAEFFVLFEFGVKGLYRFMCRFDVSHALFLRQFIGKDAQTNSLCYERGTV